MKIAKFQFNMFSVNCYVVWNESTSECMVVDPGMISTAENQSIDGFIAANNLTVKHVVNTHLHLDHCFGDVHMTETYGVMPQAHPDDFSLGRDLQAQARMFGIFDLPVSSAEEFIPLRPGDVIALGDERIEVRHVPGHSPGGIILYAPNDGWAIVGDAVFAGGGVGRTDLPGGDYARLSASIRSQILSLPPGTKILPGHGPSFSL